MTTNSGKSKWVVVAVACLLCSTGWTQTSVAPFDALIDTTNIQPATITIPAGSRLLVTLVSPLHTTSATPGSGIYSQTAVALVQDNRVVIPSRAQVQGVVEAEQRPGRVKGKAQFLLHFTTLIFPNNYVVPIDGALQSIPGSAKLRPRGERATVEPVDQIDKDVASVVKPSLVGGALGSIHSLGPGTFIGAGAGALAGLAKVLFSRGDEIRLPAGTMVEIVLQRPITLDLDRTR